MLEGEVKDYSTQASAFLLDIPFQQEVNRLSPVSPGEFGKKENSNELRG